MVEYKLLRNAEEELLEEAKRIVPIVYDENSIMYLKDYATINNSISKIYRNYNIDIEFRLIKLCSEKHERRDYLNLKYGDLNESIEHKKMYIDYKLKNKEDDLYEVSRKMAEDIKRNIVKYKNKSLFEIIPKLSKKYIKSHYDSVDFMTLFMLLEKDFFENNIKVNGTIIYD